MKSKHELACEQLGIDCFVAHRGRVMTTLAIKVLSNEIGREHDALVLGSQKRFERQKGNLNVRPRD